MTIIRFYPLFALSYKPKRRIKFLETGLTLRNISVLLLLLLFYFLFIASRALLHSHARFTKLL